MNQITVILGKMYEGGRTLNGEDPVLSWRKRNPEKHKAQALAYRHRKELLKDACEICGTKEKLETHHPDYSRPLFVRTLCKMCHEKVQC